MKSNYNIHNKYDKLKTVMLGDTYYPEFFDTIKNDKIKSALQRIAHETQEELEYYQKVLKDFGCDVLRPELDRNDKITNYVGKDGEAKLIVRPPLQPRDAQLVIKNHCFVTGTYGKIDNPAIRNELQFYDNEHLVDIIPYGDLTALDAPCFTLNNNDLWINDEYGHFDVKVDKTIKGFQLDILKEYYPDLNIHLLDHEGHSDGCFAILKPGCIITINDIQDYEKNHPGWDICTLFDYNTDISREMSKWNGMKRDHTLSFWVPGEEDNKEFQHYVETWLKDWVGWVEESVFDVNVLVLDEHNVCVSNPNNPIINAFFKKHKIDAVHIPWRHRFFWDGGLHCITLDLERESYGY